MCETCHDRGIYRLGQYVTEDGKDVVTQNICDCPAGIAFREQRDLTKKRMK